MTRHGFSSFFQFIWKGHKFIIHLWQILEDMADNKLKRLPIGIQTFSEVRNLNMLYIDKTEYIYNMVHLFKYVFLSRPRRFGKSLLVSTMQDYFEGRKELFKGLAIEQLETEWEKHPVLRFDMGTAKHTDKTTLELELSKKLTIFEVMYGKGGKEEVNLNQRLQGVIERAYAQTGKQVIVLIDEYDAPLLDVAHQDTHLQELRQVMRNFYAPLKACDPYLKFVFLTGITKFSQLSIFSELNNLKNISMLPAFAAVCGISKEEMQSQMTDYLEEFAEALQTTTDEVVSSLLKQYDGYHFTWPSPDIINPFSLLNALQDKALGNYWFSSGTPTIIIEMLRKWKVTPSEMSDFDALAIDFDTPVETMTTLIPLLYQSGYITIKDANLKRHRYRLGIPNMEVQAGLMNNLVPYYVSADTVKTNNTAEEIAYALSQDDIGRALLMLQKFLLTIPQCNHTNYEGHYQQMLFVIFSLLGQFNYMEVEVRTATGRVDMVMRTTKALYLFELKLNQSSDVAMEQIELKEYPARFAGSGLPIVKVAINFDSERHTIADWKIEAEER